MDDFWMGAACGWSLGGTAMWLWFHLNGLIRTREEWEASNEQD